MYLMVPVQVYITGLSVGIIFSIYMKCEMIGLCIYDDM